MIKKNMKLLYISHPYKDKVASILTYGSETWKTTEKGDLSEQRCLRQVLGIKRPKKN